MTSGHGATDGEEPMEAGDGYDLNVPEWMDRVFQVARSTPGWSSAVFTTTEDETVSPEFRERCREAGKRAYVRAVMAKLKEAHQPQSFVPKPIGDYLYQLAGEVKIDLDPVFEGFGLSGRDTAVTPQTARILADLARKTGISRLQTDILIRVSFALQTEHLVGVRGLYLGKRPCDTPEKCEKVLASIEAKYSVEQAALLRELEDAVRSVYNEQPG